MKKTGAIITILLLIGLLVLIGIGINKHIYNSKAGRIYQEADNLLQQKDFDSATAAYERIINDFSKSSFALKAQLGLADTYIASGKLNEAKEIYKNLLLDNLDSDIARTIDAKLGNLNVRILFSPVKVQDSVIYKVQPSDTLEGISKKYNTTVALIKRANNIKTNVIRPGMDLKISTAKFSIFVDKSDNVLTLKSGEEVVKRYLVSTGANNSTPVGKFIIINKIVDPPWFLAGKAIPPGDPKNVLGSRWMGLTKKSYGIHGTTDDISIGKQCTQGCVRMHNFEVEELYDIVPVGTEVTITD